jgi:hypothetical protein
MLPGQHQVRSDVDHLRRIQHRCDIAVAVKSRSAADRPPCSISVSFRCGQPRQEPVSRPAAPDGLGVQSRSFEHRQADYAVPEARRSPSVGIAGATRTPSADTQATARPAAAWSRRCRKRRRFSSVKRDSAQVVVSADALRTFVSDLAGSACERPSGHPRIDVAYGLLLLRQVRVHDARHTAATRRPSSSVPRWTGFLWRLTPSRRTAVDLAQYGCLTFSAKCGVCDQVPRHR